MILNKENKIQFKNIENISAYDFYKFYLRNSRLFGIIWFFLSVCFTISILIIFMSPEWISNTKNSSNRGYFGLYSFCTFNDLSNDYECFGTWTNYNSLPKSAAIKAACFFIGFTLIISVITILSAAFTFFIKPERVFHICAWLQLISTISLLVGILLYPVGWSASVIRSVCGQETNQFKIGTCSFRWPFIIAIISVFQIFLLSILSFLLASRQAKFILMHTSKNRFDLIDSQANQQL